MRTKLFPCAPGFLFLLPAFLAGMFVSTIAIAQTPTPDPAITSVRLEGTNVVVTARVPEGVCRVTLECRERFARGTWEPRVVARADGAGGLITFRLPRSRQIEMMRVRADTTEPLPANFYSGTNQFYEMSGGAGIGMWYTAGPLDTRNLAPTETPREVVESDIWKIRGQTLYFFNQLRGLQAIDLTEPDAPQVRGTIELPAVGEDLYILGEKHLILLARNGCSYNESEVVIAVDNGATPMIAARLPVSGYIQESRLVGTALYVASSAYRPVENGGSSVWEWGTLVSAFDLADPESPVIRNTLWFAGYGHVVSATDRLLFVVTQDPSDWWQSIVRSVDITSPDGTIRAYESIRTAGRVPDKFKLNWDDGILTSISEDWRAVPGRLVTTMVETFRLPDPRSLGPAGVIKLGELEVGRGEQLHATRFDGDRLYIVTFFRIDPLWVIDLSNPAAPRIAGSVDVPGWSTFIQPLDDRLVTIGVESNRVAVSLFNVANPAAPVLSDRVHLGQNYSYSEANWDEKAFSVLPDAGLILVPFSGDTTNGYASSVQLIDLNADSLVARGVIQHQFQPRRATLYSDRILSVSGWELLSVDAADRDHPAVRGTLTLAWPVDRVFLHGDFLVELGGAGGWSWWGTSDQPAMRVALAHSPNDILSQTELTPLPVLGATVRGAKLYVAQGQQSWYYGPFLFDGSDPDGTKQPASKLLVTVFDLSALPAVQKLGEVETSIGGFSGSLQALWPKPDLLVFAGGGGFSYGWPCLSCPVPLAVEARLIWPGPPFSSGGGRLVAFNVSDPAALQFASEVNLGTNNWWNFSPAFTANGLVYLSHQVSDFFAIPTTTDPGFLADPNVSPTGSWISRSFLDVVDFADANHPVVRQPANIPGRLSGISHDGWLLYTTGTHWTTNTATAWLEYLDASAYDGVSAHLVDSLALPNAWPHPVQVSGTNVFIGWPDYTSTGTVDISVVGVAGVDDQTAAAHSLQTWFVSKDGKFTRSGRVTLKNGVSSLADFDGLLAAQQTDNTLTLFDASDGTVLRRVGEGRPVGCQWYDLTHADGALGRGLWLPLGAYGVARLPAQP